MGKTGTAQKYENGSIARGKYVSSFFGTYPALDPEYALLICVNEPSKSGYYGSVVASPYGAKIFEKLFEYKNIPKDFEQEESYFSVPSLVGLTLSEAVVLLEKNKIYYEIDGDGGVVTSQFPSADSLVRQGSYVVITTN